MLNHLIVVSRPTVDPESAHFALSETVELFSVGKLRVSGLESSCVSKIGLWTVKNVVALRLEGFLGRRVDHFVHGGVELMLLGSLWRLSAERRSRVALAIVLLLLLLLLLHNLLIPLMLLLALSATWHPCSWHVVLRLE